MTALPKRRTRERSGIRKDDGPIRCPGHLQFIRARECSVKSTQCGGPIEAAHVRMGTDGGTSQKPSDCYTVPLCSEHHRIQHGMPEREFWKGHGLDPLKIAAGLWAISPAGIRYRSKRPVRQE